MCGFFVALACPAFKIAFARRHASGPLCNIVAKDSDLTAGFFFAL